MKFYLMRHAESEDGEQLDPVRTLTGRGERQAKTMGRFLATQTNKIGLIVHSDLARGRDTADILAKQLDVDTEQTPLVGPDGEAKKVFKLITQLTAKLDDDEELLVISHGPLINRFAAYLLASGEGDKFHFSHATVCHFDTENPEGGAYGYEGRGAGQPAFLHWMATANLVSRLQEEDPKAVIEAAAAVADGLAGLLEAPRGESLKHPKHLRLVAPLRAKVKAVAARYFKRQGEAIRGYVTPSIYQMALDNQQEAVGDKAKRFAADLLPDSIEPLAYAVTDAQAKTFTEALSDAITKAGRQLAKDLKSGAVVPDDKLESYLDEHSLSKLTGDWSETTLDRLRGSIADSYEKGGTYDDIVGAIQDTVASFSDVRAGMIAQTEVNDAYNYGRHQVAIAAGMDEKAWDPDGEACDLCLGNVDDGWIPIDDTFSSGDDAPTAHPNCDCSISFRSTRFGGEEAGALIATAV